MHMTAEKTLEILLNSFDRYYDVQRSGVMPPFAATAQFHSCEKGYFLTKKAVTSEAESHEYVFFYTTDRLDAEKVQNIAHLAWEEGLREVEPHTTHKSSDVAVVYICEAADEEAFREIKKLRLRKSYKWGFHGYSHLRVIAFDSVSCRMASNPLGSHMKKLFTGISKKIRDTKGF